MRKPLSVILYAVFFLAGLSLLLYPSASDRWNALRQSQAIAGYVEQVASLNRDVDKLWSDTEAYNRFLWEPGNSFVGSEEQTTEYQQLLNVTEDGMMGYIEIPDIRCTLPIYHGTEESVLQTAVGHVEWSSLPVGGESTHCVLLGHRGLPSARLFTDLDQLGVGNVFRLRVLDEVLTYEVDQILVVEPQETAALQIVEGKDYCTLVTCTPYGINTHRLLVRGHRIENVRQ